MSKKSSRRTIGLKWMNRKRVIEYKTKLIDWESLAKINKFNTVFVVFFFMLARWSLVLLKFFFRTYAFIWFWMNGYVVLSVTRIWKIKAKKINKEYSFGIELWLIESKWYEILFNGLHAQRNWNYQNEKKTSHWMYWYAIKVIYWLVSDWYIHEIIFG